MDRAQALAEPRGETCCQEGTGLGAHLAAWCPRQWWPMPGGQLQARVPLAQARSQPSACCRNDSQVPAQAFSSRGATLCLALQ